MSILGMAAVFWAGLGLPASADDTWAEFRGPAGQGHAKAVGLPREWSESKNVVWKVPIHGRGWSSPVVWGKQIWMTSATPEGKELYAICIDKETGKTILDAKVYDIPKPENTQRWNSFASPTPVIEEGRVYLHFGSYGTLCLATDTGKVVWSRQDLPCNHWRGPGSSPILWKDFLIIPFDGYDVQYVVALDKRTGKTVWRADRDYDFGTSDGDLKKCFATPIVIEVAGKPQLIATAAKAAVAYDPQTGRELWKVRYDNHSTGTRPLFAEGTLFITNGSPPAQLLAIRPGGSGDVTSSHILWRWNKGVGQKPSPLFVDGLIYVAADQGGLLSCIDAKTGAEVWKQRVGGKGHSASPLYADGVIYLFAEDGTAIILEPGRTYKELARNKLDAGCMATPAIVGQALIVRTETHLYRIESKP